MRTPWSVFDAFTQPGIARVCENVTIGPDMRPEDAQEIVDAHNRHLDPQWLQDFDRDVTEFLASRLVSILETSKEPSSSNYWRLVSVMGETATTMLKSFLDSDLVSLKTPESK